MSSEQEPCCPSNQSKRMRELVDDINSGCKKSKSATSCYCDGSGPRASSSKGLRKDEKSCKTPPPAGVAIKNRGPCPAIVGVTCKAPVPKLGQCSSKESAVDTLMCDFWKNAQPIPTTPKYCSEKCIGKCNKDKNKGAAKGPCSKAKSILATPSKECKDCKPKRVSVPGSPKKHDCSKQSAKKAPLKRALCNLKSAASFERNCAERMSELMSTEASLTDQINNLEEQEKKGVGLLKEADCMWSCMEEEYKRQIDAAKETCKGLQKEVKELDADLNSWRKTQRDIDVKVKKLDNACQEIRMKSIEKRNDIQVLTMEIEGCKKRIASNSKDLETAKNSYKSKQEASEARMYSIDEEIQQFQQKTCNECQCKDTKEQEGSHFIREARDDLQNICKCLLQKKLENGDLRAEKEALLQEIDLLKATADTCSERCAKRQKNIADETKRLDGEISHFQGKCIQCHRHTDSTDLTGFCIDCPRCLQKRQCVIKGEECSTDHTKDCICTRVKEVFLDNVFENMYSVLEKQVKTCSGKELADCIFTCLERSKNGKLDENTRKILQEFILSTVKKNLTLTIVGGAVKTRCEMDPETYEQLMLCLKDITATKIKKKDQGTIPKKPPCSRWNETSECHCPRGPRNCPCTRKAPKPPTEPGTCGPYEDEDDPDSDTDSSKKRKPCDDKCCVSATTFRVHMRAAQCMLGPEYLANRGQHPQALAMQASPPIIPGEAFDNEEATCIPTDKEETPCDTESSSEDRRIEQSRHRIIEGVLGKYSELLPIEEIQRPISDSEQLIPIKTTSSGDEIVARDSLFYLSNDLLNGASSKGVFQDESEELVESVVPIDIDKQTITSEKNAIDQNEPDPIVSKTLMPLKHRTSGLNCLWSKSISQETEQANSNLAKPLEENTSSDILPLVSKHSSVNILLSNKQSNSITNVSKEMSVNRPIKIYGKLLLPYPNTGEVILYPNGKEKQEDQHVNPVVDEEIINDATDSSDKKEVVCSAVSLKSESILKLIDSDHKTVTLRRNESNQCCKDNSTSVCAGLLCDIMERSDNIPKHVRLECSRDSALNELLEKIEFWQAESEQPKKRIQFETIIEEPARQNSVQGSDATNILPLQLPYFLKNMSF